MDKPYTEVESQGDRGLNTMTQRRIRIKEYLINIRVSAERLNVMFCA